MIKARILPYKNIRVRLIPNTSFTIYTDTHNNNLVDW